jgi:uncharacterized protein YukE
MKRIRYIVAILALISLAGLFNAVHAQIPYRMSEREVKNLLDRIEKSADRYRDSVSDALDKSRFDDTRSEDNINQFIKDFEAATDRLEDRFDDNQSAAGLVEEVLKRGVQIDSFMMRHRLTSRAHNDWMQLRRDLDDLARAYNVTWTWSGDLTRAYRVNYKQVENLLERIEKDAERFRKSLDAALDRSRLDDTNAEDNINQFVKNFEEATDRLEDRFDKKQSAAGDVEEALSRAARIDNFMRRHRLMPRAQNDWGSLRRSLDELALAYRVTWRW